MKRWIFVIDTEQYAGNFEREMCAYITGVTGECGVGEDFANLYLKETGEEESRFIELLEQVSDDHGCHRPCVIYPTPGWFNHGHGEHFKDWEENKALADYIKLATARERKELKLIKTQIIPTLKRGETWSNWTLTHCKRKIKELNVNIEKIKNTERVTQYPAYLSVAIFFQDEPSEADIVFMKKRARTFASASRKLAKDNNRTYGMHFKLNITGFRLFKEESVVSEIKI